MAVKNTQEFIIEASKKHNNFYDYSKVVYTKSRENVIITCPIHGDYLQMPNNHLSGASCNKCARVRTEDAVRLTLDKFLERSKEIHGDRYDYSKVVYTDIKKDVDIICNVHGVFQQSCDNHLQGKGCRSCAIDSRADKKRSNIEEFIEKAIKKHNGKYSYKNSVYVDSKTELIITCPIHGDFKQTPNTHLRGSSCTECKNLNNSFSRAKYIEMSKGKDTTLYLIRCWNEEEDFYKIGKTYNDIYERYRSKSKMPYNFESVKEFISDAGTIHDLEIKVHKNNFKHKYTPLLNFKGKGECYNSSILEENLF